MTASTTSPALPTSAEFARQIDGLVGSARAGRDGVFNQLDALDRQSRAACDELVRDARRFVSETLARSHAQPSESGEQRDARFDPEEWDREEWELPGATSTTATASSPLGAAPGGTAARSDDDEDDYPDTWLR